MEKDFRINNFDLIRIAAATLVLINHSLAHLKLTTPLFYTVFQQFPGVPMFFVMSGFLLSASMERTSDLKSYFTNRILRIYPGLWVCLIITVILFAAIGGVNFFNKEAIPWFLSQVIGVIYTPHFLSNFGFGSYNGSLWTTVVEIQFYLLLPVTYIIATKFIKNKRISNIYFYILFVLSFLLAFALKLNFEHAGPDKSFIQKLLRYSIVPHLYIFMCGIILQRLKIYNLKFIYGKGLYWVVGYLLFVYLVPYSVPKYMISMLILGVCTISVGYSIPGLATKFLHNRDISYGVYMYHGMILTLLVELNLTGRYSYMLIVFIVTVILSYLSYRFVESPAMALAKKRNKARTDSLKNNKPEPVPEQKEINHFTPENKDDNPNLSSKGSDILLSN